MNFDEAIKKIDDLINYLDANLPDTLAVIGGDMAAAIEYRVIHTGKDSTGNNFSPYSKTKLPAFFYKGAATRAGAAGKIDTMAKEGQMLSYSDFRALLGKETQFKNFQLSGEMWSQWRVVSTSQTKTTVSFANKSAYDKANWQSAKEGKSITAPNKEEINDANQALNDFVVDAFNMIFK